MTVIIVMVLLFFDDSGMSDIDGCWNLVRFDNKTGRLINIPRYHSAIILEKNNDKYRGMHIAAYLDYDYIDGKVVAKWHCTSGIYKDKELNVEPNDCWMYEV